MTMMAPSRKGPSRPLRLGVVGTMVWDTIHRRAGRTEPVQEWGGISYGLAALAACLPEGWEVVPLIKVGEDLAESAVHFLGQLPRLNPHDGVMIVPEPNNRVELQYIDDARRCERLTGGVPPWRWEELEPLVHDLDAIYVNFISGFEMELETAQALRESYDGPTYADLHSLFLGVEAEGVRVPQALPCSAEWLRSFDAVQMNQTEFDLLGRYWGDPWAIAAQVVGPELKLIAVTLGEDGAAYVAGPEFDPDPGSWPALRRTVARAGPSRSGRVTLIPGHMGEKTALSGRVEGDPTGCGDVWGATLFGSLLGGADLEGAMRQANRLASRNVGHLGATGLHLHLDGRLSVHSERRQ